MRTIINLSAIIVSVVILNGCKSCTTTRPASDQTPPTYTLSLLKVNSDESSEIITVVNDTCIVISTDVNFFILGSGHDEQGIKRNNLSISAKCASDGKYQSNQESSGSGGNIGQNVPTTSLLNLTLNNTVVDGFKRRCASEINCFRVRGWAQNFSSQTVYSPIVAFSTSAVGCEACK